MFPSCSFNRCLFSAASANTPPVRSHHSERLSSSPPSQEQEAGGGVGGRLWRGWCLLPLSATSRQCTAGKWLNWKRRPIPSACETTAGGGGGILLRPGSICRDKPEPKRTSSGSRCQSWPVFKTRVGGGGTDIFRLARRSGAGPGFPGCRFRVGRQTRGDTDEAWAGGALAADLVRAELRRRDQIILFCGCGYKVTFRPMTGGERKRRTRMIPFRPEGRIPSLHNVERHIFFLNSGLLMQSAMRAATQEEPLCSALLWSEASFCGRTTSSSSALGAPLLIIIMTNNYHGNNNSLYLDSTFQNKCYQVLHNKMKTDKTSDGLRRVSLFVCF